MKLPQKQDICNISRVFLAKYGTKISKFPQGSMTPDPPSVRNLALSFLAPSLKNALRGPCLPMLSRISHYAYHLMLLFFSLSWPLMLFSAWFTAHWAEQLRGLLLLRGFHRDWKLLRVKLIRWSDHRQLQLFEEEGTCKCVPTDVFISGWVLSLSILYSLCWKVVIVGVLSCNSVSNVRIEHSNVQITPQ